MTPADVRQWMSQVRRKGLRVTRVVCWVMSAYAVALGVRHGLANGPTWRMGMYFLAAVVLGTPFLATELGLLCVLLFWRPPATCLSIDDDGILVQAGASKTRFAWASCSRSASLHECENHFWLQCGRRSLLIPKRAFRTDAERDEFRQLLFNKTRRVRSCARER